MENTLSGLFPIDFDRSCVLSSSEDNHSSAQQFSKDVGVYLDNEVAYDAMYGPFNENPIKCTYLHS